MFVVLGVLLGTALAFGFLPAVARVADHAAGGAVELTAVLLDRGAGLLPGAVAASRPGQLLLVLLPVLTPAVAAVAVVVALRASQLVRRLLAVGIGLSGFAGLLLVDGRASWWLFAAALAAAGLLVALAGPLVELPLATLASLLAVRAIALVVAGDGVLGDVGSALADAAAFGTPPLWRAVAVGAQLLVASTAVVGLLRRR